MTGIAISGLMTGLHQMSLGFLITVIRSVIDPENGHSDVFNGENIQRKRGIINSADFLKMAFKIGGAHSQEKGDGRSATIPAAGRNRVMDEAVKAVDT